MKKIRLYRIDLDYIKYLWNYDNKVQHNINESNNYNKKRPYIGIVLNINKLQYFAPLEHPRESHKKLKNNKHIIKIGNGKYGLIAFNNMIPVNKSELICFDFKSEDINYRNILTNQFIFCDNNKRKIFNYANETYNKVVEEKIPFFINVCCNFKLLEQKCLEYETYLKSTKEVAVTREIEDEDDWDLEL